MVRGVTAMKPDLLWVILLLFCQAFTVMPAFALENGPHPEVKEENLYIYGDLDPGISAPLVKAFESANPGVTVDFVTMKSGDIFFRYMNDIAGKKVSADILWSREIILQAELAKDGFTKQYTPQTVPALFPGAVMSGSVFAATLDPVVMVYNRNLLQEKDLPVSRAGLVKAVKNERWQGRLGVCDPEKSETAFLLLTQDLAYGSDFWGMIRKLGDAGLRVYPDYRSLLEKVTKGELVYAYNVPLSEVIKAKDSTGKLSWYYLDDYSLALPETVLITKVATNPVNARAWIDFILSEKAQQLIAARSHRYGARSDVSAGEMSLQGGALPGSNRLKIIGTGTEVTRFGTDGMKRGFILRWKQLLKLVPP